MARANTNTEVVAEVTEVGVMTDVASSPGSTTLSAAAAEGATSLSVAAGTNFGNGDKLRLGDRPLIEAAEIESGGGTTTLTLVSAISDDYASGEAVVEVEDTPIGDLTEEGVSIVYDGGDQAVRSGTRRGAFTYIPSSDQALSLQFSLLNLSMENFAAHAGLDEASRITGAGTAADPYVMVIREGRYAEVVERIWYFAGVRVDGTIIRVEGNSGKIFAPSGQVQFAQGVPSELPFLVRVLHGVKISQYS